MPHPITRHPERMVAVASLRPFDRNPRTHGPEQVKQIARSIQTWGWTNPLLIEPDGTIIAGHGRLLAATSLGITEVPAVTLEGLDAEQKAALVVADNQLALNAGWDDALLSGLLADLGAAQFDLSLLGMSDEEMNRLMEIANAGGGGQTDPDDTPEIEEQAITEVGDVWIMGRHRLCCGDSTSPEAIERLTKGARADLCFTSPPYGNQRDYKTGGISDWDALMRGVFGVLPVKQEAQVLVNLGLIHREGEWLPYWDGWIEWMRSQGWRRFGWYVWDQGPGLPGDWNGRLAPSHEFMFHFNRVSDKARKTKESKCAGSISNGGLRESDGSIKGRSKGASKIQDHKIPDSVVRVMRHKGGLGDAGSHPAVFPVDLVSEIMTAYSDPDDTVFEPFSGSGTQIISAQKNGRTCLAMELAPAYCDVAVLRWQTYVKATATLESTGETFAEVLARRQPGAVIQAAETQAAETPEPPKRRGRGKKKDP